MCGIIGFAGFESKEAKELAEQGLEKTFYRGKDARKIVSFGEVIFGHNLHSVISEVKQPLKGKKGILVSNCEIYNWKEIAKKNNIKAKNDSELLLKLIEKKGISKIDSFLKEIDGDYAFAYSNKSKIVIARDIAGVKPLVYYNKKGKFAFASEKKALPFNSVHLNPRKYIIFDLKTKKLSLKKRKISENKILGKERDEIKRILLHSIDKRIPDKKFGLLFSGGIDSVLIAKILSEREEQFNLYFSGIKGLGEPKDLKNAEKTAKELGCKLKKNMVSVKKFEKELPKIISLIESSDPVRVGVASTIYFATKQMKKEKVVFSGLGADELFGGYSRFKNSNDINKDVYSYLIKMYENDLYFEDIVCMYNNLELRVPYLDKEMISSALALDSKFKISKGINKKILREIAVDYGLGEEIAMRPKKAAQYGSNFDKAIEKLAKKNGFKRKSDYLNSLAPQKNIKIGALISTGKDSLYAMYLMAKQGYEISCFITIDSKNKDSFMYHTPTIDLAKLQAKAMDLPIIIVKTKGKKEEELKELEKAISDAKRKYNIEGVCSGALYSNYQRSRIEKICEKLAIRAFAPIWHLNQTTYLKQTVKAGFKTMITKIACYGVDSSFLGKEIDSKTIDALVALEKKIGMNVAGEGGEYETLVSDMPLFMKKIVVENTEKQMENEFTGTLEIKKAKLVEK